MRRHRDTHYYFHLPHRLYSMLHACALLSLFVLQSLFLQNICAQTIFSGTVIDIETTEPLSGANVFVKGTVSGAASGNDGSFSLSTNQSLPLTLTIRYLGYDTQEILVSVSSSDILVRLSPVVVVGNEIVVTSQLRSQELQEVPMAVSVLDQDAVQRIHLLDHPSDIALYTPGLSGNDPEIGASYLTIRGIGSNAFGIGLESSVGIFVDDVYAGRVTATSATLDVERIEVAKGPQNTLFGRNASAGVISIISNKPKNEKELSLSIGIGNEGQREAIYIANYPISNRLFMRLAGKLDIRDGLRTVTNFKDRQIGKLDLFTNRLSLLYRPVNDLSFQFSIEHQNVDGGGYALYSINSDLGVSGSAFDRDIELSSPGFEDETLLGFRLQIDKIINDNLYLKSISGLRYPTIELKVDADGSPTYIMDFGYLENSTTFSQDLRLIGRSNRLDWLLAAGIFSESIVNIQSPIFDDHVFVGDLPIGENELGFEHEAFLVCDNTSDQLLGPCISDASEESFNRGDYFSYAFYGDLTYSISEKLNLTTGLRYTKDNKKFRTSTPFGNGVTYIIFGDNLLGPNTGDDELRDEKFWYGLQPRIALDYSPSSDLMIYTNYSRGYKAGGFNTVSAIPFDEESSNSYEFGIKTEFGEGQYKLNVSGYFIDYNNLQVQNIVNTIIAVDNAADVESKGIEVEASAVIIKDFFIKANTSIGQARYQNYEVVDGNFNGNTPDRSPDNTFGLVAQYEATIENVGNLVIRADYDYQSKVYFRRDNRDDLSQPGYGIINGYIALEQLMNGRINLALYAHNLIDQNYLVHAEDGIGVGVTTVRNIPRLIGMRLDINI